MAILDTARANHDLLFPPLGEYRMMLGAAVEVGVTPVEVKEIVYQAVPYVGMGRVNDFLHATNDRSLLVAVATQLLPFIGYPRTLNALRVINDNAPTITTTQETPSMTDVVVVIGAGSIGQAIARRVSTGKHVVWLTCARERRGRGRVFRNAGFEVSTATVDISSRESVHELVETATALGDVTGVIHAAGVSPSRRHRRPSSPSISTAPRWCSRSSATSSPAAAPVSSSRRSPGTASAP